MEVVRRFQGRAFFDLTAIQWAFYDSFGVLPADTVKAIGGSQPVIPVPPDPLKGPQGRRRSMAGLRLLSKIWNYSGKARSALESALSHQR
jgi:pyruvate,water dikinase